MFLRERNPVEQLRISGRVPPLCVAGLVRLAGPVGQESFHRIVEQDIEIPAHLTQARLEVVLDLLLLRLADFTNPAILQQSESADQDHQQAQGKPGQQSASPDFAEVHRVRYFYDSGFLRLRMLRMRGRSGLPARCRLPEAVEKLSPQAED